ncbi:hypothetical protein COT97_05630 [Candidatus Falkowbacteria bacterium CG10_big_fil_rev_8_21_14_0_10_39_11]|uniref:Uncharacterized protein n=1 Tax=Candidatus Falkowbacteria bacterium CG10_big_fil_rev_8_21_14_0_10_39_11 TaxID=1974565 RepID=A0A2H0V3E2_9BACT|nr:MAG: hypothetical protein COT97_05630 [Candidatus Falkowbacteria bacterium CG10_big_fil_rev_8_21_14_0_10_39_11]
MAEHFYCKRCGKSMTREDVNYTRIFMTQFMGKCEECRTRIRTDYDKMKTDFKRVLEGAKLSEREIKERLYAFEQEHLNR